MIGTLVAKVQRYFNRPRSLELPGRDNATLSHYYIGLHYAPRECVDTITGERSSLGFMTSFTPIASGQAKVYGHKMHVWPASGRNWYQVRVESDVHAFLIDRGKISPGAVFLGVRANSSLYKVMAEGTRPDSSTCGLFIPVTLR
jgi:hypothetical protein